MEIQPTKPEGKAYGLGNSTAAVPTVNNEESTLYTPLYLTLANSDWEQGRNSSTGIDLLCTG